VLSPPASHLAPEQARGEARAALAALWPEWSMDLQPLKPAVKPRRATVFRVSGGPQPAVVKLWAPAHAAQARAQAQRQAEVAAGMAQDPWRAAPVLGFDADRRALVMADAGGPDLAQALAEGMAPAAALIRAGAWLGAFHGLSLRPHPFRPAGPLHWLNRLRAEAGAGRRALPDPEGFARHVAALQAMAPALRGSPAARAVTHRDLTLSNLLIGPRGQLWGIDFENGAEDEPLRDLFTLALDALARGAPPEALVALRQGYGAPPGSPGARLFLQRAFALGTLARLPARPSARQSARAAAAEWLLQQAVAVL
jgi:hypothetical protein